MYQCNPLAGSYTNRVSALNPHTSAFLEGLGAWSAHMTGKAHGFSRMFVWDECSPANIEFRNDDGAPMAHMVENDVTVAALTRHTHTFEFGGLFPIL